MAHASSLEACTCQLQGLSPQNSKDFVQMVRKVIASEEKPWPCREKNKLQPPGAAFGLRFILFQGGEGEGFERLGQGVGSGAHLKWVCRKCLVLFGVRCPPKMSLQGLFGVRCPLEMGLQGLFCDFWGQCPPEMGLHGVFGVFLESVSTRDGFAGTLWCFLRYQEQCRESQPPQHSQ